MQKSLRKAADLSPGNPQMVLVTDFAVSDFSLRGPWKAVGAEEITPHCGPVRSTWAENTTQIRALVWFVAFFAFFA